MSQTTAPSAGPAGQSERVNVASGDSSQLDHPVSAAHAHHGRRVRHFLWHLAEMLVAMMIGMAVAVGVFSAVVGENYGQARHRYPTAALLVMAVGMAVPMVAWMRFRRHTWKNSIEMGAAMMLPAVPFLACVWAHVFVNAPTGPYMAVSTVAMLGLMLYRWEVYSAHPAKLVRAHAH